MSGEEDVHVEKCEGGWAVTRGTRRLKTFRDGQQHDGLQPACEWGWDYASQRGITAWLRHGRRRSRINFG